MTDNDKLDWLGRLFDGDVIDAHDEEVLRWAQTEIERLREAVALDRTRFVSMSKEMTEQAAEIERLTTLVDDLRLVVSEQARRLSHG